MGNICTSCRGAEVSITPRVTAEAPRDPPQDPPTDTGNISPSQYPADISPSLPPADGWLVPNVQLDEKALIELSIAIESRIVSVRGGAAAALGHLEIMRATASSGADADATRAIDARVAALAEEVALAEAAKVASLEAELVQADEALERLQAGNTSSDSLRVLFGPGALFPMEPSALRLEPSATPGEIATLFAPRCVGGQIFHVRRRIVPSDLVDIPEFCVLAVTPEVLHVLTVEHEHAVSLRDPVSWAHTPTTLTLVAMTAAREWRAVVFDTALGGEVAEAIEGFYAPAGYDQIDPFRERRAREISAITRLDAVTLEGDEPAWYIVSERWLLQWRTFAGYTPASNRPWAAALPPGPIKNAILLDGAGRPHPNLEKKTDYRAVVSRVWVALHAMYGGGPVIKRREIDLYGEAAA